MNDSPDRPDEELTSEAQALRRIARVLESEQTRQRGSMNSVLQQIGLYTDPKEAREEERADREREQAKLYRLQSPSQCALSMISS